MTQPVLCSICRTAEVPSPGDLCAVCLRLDQLARGIEFPTTVRLDIGPDDPRYAKALREATERAQQIAAGPAPLHELEDQALAATLRLIDEFSGRHFKAMLASGPPTAEQLDAFWEHGWDFVQVVKRDSAIWCLILRRRRIEP